MPFRYICCSWSFSKPTRLQTTGSKPVYVGHLSLAVQLPQPQTMAVCTGVTAPQILNNKKTTDIKTSTVNFSHLLKIHMLGS